MFPLVDPALLMLRAGDRSWHRLGAPATSPYTDKDLPPCAVATNPWCRTTDQPCPTEIDSTRLEGGTPPEILERGDRWLHPAHADLAQEYWDPDQRAFTRTAEALGTGEDASGSLDLHGIKVDTTAEALTRRTFVSARLSTLLGHAAFLARMAESETADRRDPNAFSAAAELVEALGPYAAGKLIPRLIATRRHPMAEVIDGCEGGLIPQAILRFLRAHRAIRKGSSEFTGATGLYSEHLRPGIKLVCSDPAFESTFSAEDTLKFISEYNPVILRTALVAARKEKAKNGAPTAANLGNGALESLSSLGSTAVDDRADLLAANIPLARTAAAIAHAYIHHPAKGKSTPTPSIAAVFTPVAHTAITRADRTRLAQWLATPGQPEIVHALAKATVDLEKTILKGTHQKDQEALRVLRNNRTMPARVYQAAAVLNTLAPDMATTHAAAVNPDLQQTNTPLGTIQTVARVTAMEALERKAAAVADAFTACNLHGIDKGSQCSLAITGLANSFIEAAARPKSRADPLRTCACGGTVAGAPTMEQVNLDFVTGHRRAWSWLTSHADNAGAQVTKLARETAHALAMYRVLRTSGYGIAIRETAEIENDAAGKPHYLSRFNPTSGGGEYEPAPRTREEVMGIQVVRRFPDSMVPSWGESLPPCFMDATFDQGLLVIGVIEDTHYRLRNTASIAGVKHAMLGNLAAGLIG